MGIRNWMFNRKLKKDRLQNPHLYSGLENYAIKYSDIDFETDHAKLEKQADKDIERLKNKIERFK